MRCLSWTISVSQNAVFLCRHRITGLHRLRGALGHQLRSSSWHGSTISSKCSESSAASESMVVAGVETDGDGGDLTFVKYLTQKKTLKITNSLSFLINVLTIINQLNIPMSTWGQNTNLPSTSVLPCSALANVEIPGNLFGSCRCHVHSSLRTRIGETTVQLST